MLYLGSRTMLKMVHNDQINRFRGSQNGASGIGLSGVDGFGRVQAFKVRLPDEGVPGHVRPEVDLLVDDGGHLLVHFGVHGLRDSGERLLAENVVAAEPGAGLQIRHFDWS